MKTHPLKDTKICAYIVLIAQLIKRNIQVKKKKINIFTILNIITRKITFGPVSLTFRWRDLQIVLQPAEMVKSCSDFGTDFQTFDPLEY